MLKIGILQSAGIAGSIIEHALNHPEQEEVFVPVIYSKENQNDKNVGSDLKFGNIEAVVVAPGSSKEFNFDGSMTISMDEYNRVACVLPEAPVAADNQEAAETPASTTVTAEQIERCVNTMWHSMHRDFLISLPRIAILATGNEDIDKNIIDPLVKQLTTEKHIGAFGPFAIKEYMEQGRHLDFDVTLAITSAQAQQLVDNILPPTYTKFIAGIPMVLASTAYTAATPIAEDDLDEPAAALRNAVYTCMDIVRHRQDYDAAHRDPLQKLYHERRDDSEKTRFAVKKPFPPKGESKE